MTIITVELRYIINYCNYYMKDEPTCSSLLPTHLECSWKYLPYETRCISLYGMKSYIDFENHTYVCIIESL